MNSENRREEHAISEEAAIVEEEKPSGNALINMIRKIDPFRRNLIIALWGGGCTGAIAGYCVSVLKGAPISLYISSMTITFSAASMVFYTSYHYLRKGMGDTIYTTLISGATTGIIAGLLSNPRHLPVTTLCFTGASLIGYACYMGLHHHYRLKQLRLRKEMGVITAEEEEVGSMIRLVMQEMENMNWRRKIRMPSWSPIKYTPKEKKE